MPGELMSENQWAFLEARMSEAGVVLFLGAGFCAEAMNETGESPPLGSAMARLLAGECGFEFQNEPLPTVYEVAQRRLGAKKLLHLLRTHFMIKGCADWYRILPTFVWHRIYTTNIDSLLDFVYSDPPDGGSNPPEQQLRRIVCPAWPEERDQLLGSVQAVHLHGCLLEPEKPLTFTFDDFAKQTTRPNTWYQQLIDDLYSMPVVFIGTQLQDSPFHHYLEERGIRDRGEREIRPMSFLVDRAITPIRREQLSGSNIVAVSATAEEFFREVRRRIPEDVTKVERIRTVIRPDLEIRPSGPVSSPVVGRHFYLIRPDALPASPVHAQADQFFLGAEPDWADIATSRDADREVNVELLSALQKKPHPRCVFVHGPAGCGKTTTAMRVATLLAADGSPTWYASIAERIDLEPLLDKIHGDESRAHHYIFIDVASRQLDSVSSVMSRLRNSPRITLVLIDRTNSFVNKRHSLARLEPLPFRMPDMENSDIHRILERLERFGCLGVLKGMPAEQRFAEFKSRAESQILVAMKEATSGRGFDMILHGEYGELHDQAKLAYLICCLAVSQGAPGVYRRNLLPCLERTGFAKAKVIDDLLRGVLVRANASGSLLKPRHRRIARFVVKEIAHDQIKENAVIRFLCAVSGDIVPGEIKRRTPAFLGYRGLINSYALGDIFADQSRALRVYESVRDLYSDDFLFWLHFGMTQMEGGHFDVAENYLNQSLGLFKHNFQAQHQLGILHLRVAANTEVPELATERAQAGIEILDAQIRERGLEDSYPYAAYLQYVMRWYVHAGDIISGPQWEALRGVATRAKELYAADEIISDAALRIERAYMMKAVHR